MPHDRICHFCAAVNVALGCACAAPSAVRTCNVCNALIDAQLPTDRPELVITEEDLYLPGDGDAPGMRIDKITKPKCVKKRVVETPHEKRGRGLSTAPFHIVTAIGTSPCTAPLS